MKSSLDTIAFFKNIRQTLEAMTDEDAGRLMKALFAHNDGEEVDLTDASPAVQMVFPLVAESTDRLARNRENKVRKPQTNRKDTANEPQTNRKDTANEPQTNRKDTAHNHNHNHNHNHSHNHPSSDEEERERELKLPKERAAMPPELNYGFVLDAWAEFKKHRTRLKKPMTDYAERLMIGKLEILANGDPLKAVEIIEQSIERGWQGLFELKDTKPKVEFVEKERIREVDYTQMARDRFLTECGVVAT